MAAVTINWMQINCAITLLLLSVVVNGKQHVCMCMYVHKIMPKYFEGKIFADFTDF